MATYIALRSRGVLNLERQLRLGGGHNERLQHDQLDVVLGARFDLGGRLHHVHLHIDDALLRDAVIRTQTLLLSVGPDYVGPRQIHVN